MSEHNEILGYADSYRAMGRQGTVNVSVWSVIADLERNMAPILAASKQREAALQQRLTAADERADLLEAGVKWESDRNALLLASLTEAEDMLSVTSLEAGQRIEVLEGLLRETSAILRVGDGYGWEDRAADRIDVALKPAEAATDEHVCNGCGAKGWTANCKECVPY